MAFHRRIDGFLHRIAHDALTELLFQDGHRDFALAKALDLNVGLRLDQLFVDLGVQFSRRHRDGVAALQSVFKGLGDLHSFVLLIPVWCGWRDLNPHASRRQNLNLVRLPISPHPHF